MKRAISSMRVGKGRANMGRHHSRPRYGGIEMQTEAFAIHQRCEGESNQGTACTIGTSFVKFYSSSIHASLIE